MNGSKHVKNPLRSSTLLISENDIKYCFLWSILASLQPCEKNHPNNITNCRQYFNEINIHGFDFTKGLKCINKHRFQELNILPLNIFETKAYQDQNKRKPKIIPIEISKNDSDKVVDLLKYRNLYALKKVNLSFY